METTTSYRPLGPRLLRRIFALPAESDSMLTVYVSDGASERIVYFTSKGVREASESPAAAADPAEARPVYRRVRTVSVGDRRGDDVEGFLLRGGILDVDRLHEAIETARARKTDLRDVLHEQKLVTRDRYDEYVRRLVRENILDLVFWEGAYFTCDTDQPPPAVYSKEERALACTLDVAALAREVRECTLLWERLRPRFGSDRAIITLTPFGSRRLGRLEGRDHAILEACRAPVELRTLWHATALDLPDLLKRLERLVTKTWITVEPPGEGDSAEREAREIERLEAALETAVCKDIVRERLVRLYRRAGRREDAAAQLEALAAEAEAQGRFELAAAELKKALRLAPERLSALESLLGLLTAAGKRKEARALAEEHGRTLLETGARRAARRAAAIIERHLGERKDVAELLADLRCGTPAAAERYLALAEEYERTGDREAALRMLRLARAEAPRDTRILESLARLDPKGLATEARGSQDSGPRSKKRALAVAPGYVLALLVALAAFGLHASGAFGALGEKITAAAGRKRREEGGANALVLRPPALPQIVLEGPARGESDPAGVSGAERPSSSEGVLQGAVLQDGAGSITETQPPVPSAPQGPSRPDFAVSLTRRPGSELHPPRERRRLVLGRDLVASSTPGGDLVLVQPSSAEEILRLPGRPGWRWNLSRSGEVACLWKPGHPLRRYERLTGLWSESSWRLPADTTAVAPGESRIALARSGTTEVRDLEGRLVSRAALSPWDYGAFAGDRLVLARRRGNALEIEVRLAETLAFLWAGTWAEGGFALR